MPRKIPIFYSALMLTGVNLLLRLAGTAFHVYVSGQIGAAGVGLLQLVMSVGGFAMTAGMGGIRTTTMYLTAEELGRKHPGRVRWILSGCFRYSILCSTAVGILLYMSAPMIADKWIGQENVIGAIRLIATFLPVNCLCGVMAGYFTAAGRIATLVAVEVAEQALSITSTMCLLSFWAGCDPSRACEAVVAGAGISSCAALIALVVLRLLERQPAMPQIPVWRRLLTCAVPLAGADILKSGITTTENMLVPKRLALYPAATNPLAVFGTVCGMVFPVLMFPAAILFGLAELLIPELARCSAAGSYQRIRYLVRRSLKAALLYGCLFGGIMFLLSDTLCQSLYKSQEAGLWLRRFSPMIPMLYCDALTDAMTKGLGQQKICVRYNILTSAMDVVLLFLLLPRHGMGGYYFSFLVTHGINFFLSLRRLVKISGIRIDPVKPLLTITATVVGMSAASLVKQRVAAGICGCVMTVCLYFLWNVLSKEDLTWVRELVRKK